MKDFNHAHPPRKIIAIVNGYPQSGKDSFVEFAGQRLAELGWEAYSLSSVDFIKDITRGFGIDDEPKTPEKRALWADLKQAFEKYDRFATRYVMRLMAMHMGRFVAVNQIGFIHVREPDAISFMETLTEHCEFLTIFIDRPDAERVTSNQSDIDVEKYPYALTVSNRGDLQDLQRAARQFAETLTAGQGPTA